jgi:hypothetical protein
MRSPFVWDVKQCSYHSTLCNIPEDWRCQLLDGWLGLRFYWKAACYEISPLESPLPAGRVHESSLEMHLWTMIRAFHPDKNHWMNATHQQIREHINLSFSKNSRSEFEKFIIDSFSRLHRQSTTVQWRLKQRCLSTFFNFNTVSLNIWATNLNILKRGLDRFYR